MMDRKDRRFPVLIAAFVLLKVWEVSLAFVVVRTSSTSKVVVPSILYRPPKLSAIIALAQAKTNLKLSPDTADEERLEQQLETALQQSANLPIVSVLDEIICNGLTNKDDQQWKPNLLLQAAPGAGKTTIVPLKVLWQQLMLCKSQNVDNTTPQKIILVAPRRVAVRSAAQRMANLLGQPVGQTIGYAVRDDAKTSPETRILVVTDGVLLNMLLQGNNPELNGISHVLLDEFHERGVGSDTALALTRQVQKTFRGQDNNNNDDKNHNTHNHPLHIFVMSATLLGDMENGNSTGSRLWDVLGGDSSCRIIQSEGRQYPIQMMYAKDIVQSMKQKARGVPRGGNSISIPPLAVLLHDRKLLTHTVANAVEYVALQIAPSKGDILVFVPGVVECKRVAAELLSRRAVSDNADVLTLYGAMSKEEQEKVLYPSPNARQRIVVSTPITEASVTLPRVSCVVDLGFRREPRCDIDTGMPRLVSTRISKASAIQRAGRAGRVQNGLCLRLYTQSEFDLEFPDQSPPEICSADLAPTLLILADLGISTINEIVQDMAFVDPPNLDSLKRAEQFLVDIQALKRNMDGTRFLLTDLGRKITKVPCHPRLAAALVRANDVDNEILLSAALVASFCLDGDSHNVRDDDADLRNRIRSIFNGSQQLSTLMKFAQRVNGTKGKSMIRKMKEDSTFATNVLERVGEAMLPGFLDMVAERKGEASYQSTTYYLAIGKSCRLEGQQGIPYILATEASTGPDGISRIRSFTPVKKELLFDYAIDTEEVYTVPSKGYEVRAKKTKAIGKLELSSAPLQVPSVQQKTEALLEAIQSLGGFQNAILKFLSPSEKAQVEDVIARIRLDQELMKGEKARQMWPPWTDLFVTNTLKNPTIEQSLREMIEPRLGSIKSLKGLDIPSILSASLDPDQLHYLDSHYPTKIQSPDGSIIPVRYDGEGQPKASAKLQQFLGTTHTPRVGPKDKAVPLSITMLSPAGHPLAETRDLSFFWNDVYPSIRSEMRGKYPKHPWPEDPLRAVATRKTKKQAEGSLPTGIVRLPFTIPWPLKRPRTSLFSTAPPDAEADSSAAVKDEKFYQRNSQWVILVDDEEDIRLAVGDFLYDKGYQVTACADADSLLEVLQTEHDDGGSQLPDAIICDIRMPLSTKNGYELVEAIRSFPEWSGIPVVMLTAKAMTQDRVQGYRVGADAFLPKPFDPNELLSILDNVIARNKQRLSKLSETQVHVDSASTDLLVLKQQLDEIKEIMEQNAAATVQKTNVFLSEDERKMLQMISDGYTYAEIAKDSDVSVKAVNRFVQKLYDKTETKTRTGLVKWAMQVGYVT